jgi:multidrug efflux pump subunit AcrB
MNCEELLALLGAAAILLWPREKEPQIKTPMIEVLGAMPDFSGQEVERLLEEK